MFQNLHVRNQNHKILLENFHKRLSSSENNTIKFNNFIENNLAGVSQAYDDGSNNVFIFNYWDDWTNPDNNADSIVEPSCYFEIL